MRKIKGKNTKHAINDILVDRVVNMHRTKCGVNVQEYTAEVVRRNQEFDEVAKSGDKERALKLRNELMEFMLATDMPVVKSMAESATDNTDIIFAVAKQKLLSLSQVEVKLLTEGVEIFDYLDEQKSNDDLGSIVDYVLSVEREGIKIEESTMVHVRVVFESYMRNLLGDVKSNVSHDELSDVEIETIKLIYSLIKAPEETPLEDLGAIISYIEKDSMTVPHASTFDFGFKYGLIDHDLVIDMVAGAGLAINTFNKNNILLTTIRQARTVLGSMFETLNLDTDTFEDVVGEATNLRDTIKNSAQLKEHFEAARQVATIYDAKFRENIIISKGHSKSKPISMDMVDLNVKYVAYGLAKVLDSIIYMICGDKLDARGVLAAIVFNLISVRIRSDRDICRGTEILAKGMESAYCSTEWSVLAEKIIYYVEGFEIPDFDAEDYSPPVDTEETKEEEVVEIAKKPEVESRLLATDEELRAAVKDVAKAVVQTTMNF